MTRLFGPPASGAETAHASTAAVSADASSREQRLITWLKQASTLAAVLVLVGGSLVLLGWWLDVRPLQAIGPVDVVMNPLSGLLFVLTGSVLLLDSRPEARRWVHGWGLACGVVVAVCGALVLMRTLADWQVGVDEVLFRQKVLRVDPPDWMAGNAALNFTLIGLALLVRRVRGRGGWRPAPWLVLPAALTSLLVVIGYLYNAAGLITFQLQLPMALNTALFFLAACFAISAAHPEEGVTGLFVSDSAGGAITRRLLPALLLVPLVVGTMINFGMGAGWYGSTVGLALLTLATIVLSVALATATAGALHRSDLALRASEEHFRTLIENSSDYVMIVDRRGEVRYVSPSVQRILGYLPEELLGLRPDELIHPSDLAAVRRSLDEVFQNPGEVVRSEFRMRHRDGRWRMFENVSRTIRADSGDAGAVANARDITERRQAEDELVRQRAYFEDILESLDAGIVVFDPTGAYEYVSASAVSEPHIRRWMVGKSMADVGRARRRPAGLIEKRVATLREAIRTRAMMEVEEEEIGESGTPRQMLRRLVPIVGEAGDLERLVAFSVDITDRKAAEVALHAAKEEAERANRAKSEFLSRMSHELRTPMNAILGFAQVLERNGLAPGQEKHLEHILNGGRHLLRLINEVLDLSRIESGRLALCLETVPVGEVIHEAVDLVQPLANSAGNALRLELPADAGILATADRQRLAQVLINLLSNAIKYNRAGGEVRLRAEVADSRVVIRVMDQGKGIPEERLDQLFTPFARLGAEQTGTEGTGLGLALSRRLARAMRGELELEHTGAEGSSFRLELRLASSPVIVPEESRAEGDAHSDGDESGATILYIEDNLANLSLIEAVLESRPRWRTMSALRGEAGVDLAREHQPDLILLDLHLPDISGFEVLKRLRAQPSTTGIPVVIVSADATPTARDRLRAAGASEYLTKPIDVDEFLAVVERLLAERASTPAPSGAG